MKVTEIVIAVLFALFAVVQLNDVDPWLWVAIYGVVAILAVLAATGRSYKYVYLAGIAICLIWIATLIPDFINWIQMGMPTITGSMKATEPHVELTREFFGLLLSAIALGVLYYRAK